MLHGSTSREDPRSTMAADRETQLRLQDGFSEKFFHRVIFTRDLFAENNDALAEVLAPRSDEASESVLLVLDANLGKAWPDFVDNFAEKIASIDGLQFRGSITVPGGEAAKNDPLVIDAVVNAIDKNSIDRHSWVVVAGGGAVIDAVGFASATAHRGVRLLRIATTVLGQLDAAIGVKNGVNRLGKKNFLGTFAVPEAVLCDENFLETLDDRDWCCGFAEAVKIACLQDAEFLEDISEAAHAIRERNLDAARPIIRECAKRHLQHIVQGGDPFERHAGRPLDFGHWCAHRLETMSNYRIRHGEAVAIGVAIDTVYSMLDGRLTEEACQRVLSTLEALGLSTFDDDLSKTDELFTGLEEFREHLGGRLTITLLGGIGQPVDVHEMDTSRIHQAIELLSRRT